MKKENQYQSELIRILDRRYPGCYVIKGDSDRRQGICDLIVLFHDQWAALEVKRSAKAPHQPNQDYYVNQMNIESFARFIFPENEDDVFHDLDEFFQGGDRR